MLFIGNLTLTHKETVARDTLLLKFSVEVNPLTDKSDTLAHSPSRQLANFDFLPGQFVSLKFGEKAWRAYSIASTPDEDHLELLIRLVENGVASEAFRQSQVEDSFAFKGPFGHFVLSEDPETHLVFCATGTGIAPFRSMIKSEASKDTPRQMTLLYGGRDPKDIAYLDELKTWTSDLDIQLAFSRSNDVETLHATSLPGTIHQGRITDLLARQLASSPAQYYLCGNGDMVVSVQEILEQQGVEKESIFLERFN